MNLTIPNGRTQVWVMNSAFLQVKLLHNYYSWWLQPGVCGRRGRASVRSPIASNPPTTVLHFINSSTGNKGTSTILNSAIFEGNTLIFYFPSLVACDPKRSLWRSQVIGAGSGERCLGGRWEARRTLSAGLWNIHQTAAGRECSEGKSWRDHWE